MRTSRAPKKSRASDGASASAEAARTVAAGAKEERRPCSQPRRLSSSRALRAGAERIPLDVHAGTVETDHGRDDVRLDERRVATGIAVRELTRHGRVVLDPRRQHAALEVEQLGPREADRLRPVRRVLQALEPATLHLGIAAQQHDVTVEPRGAAHGVPESALDGDHARPPAARRAPHRPRDPAAGAVHDHGHRPALLGVPAACARRLRAVAAPVPEPAPERRPAQREDDEAERQLPRPVVPEREAGAAMEVPQASAAEGG